MHAESGQEKGAWPYEPNPMLRLGAVPKQGQADQQRRTKWPIYAPDTFGKAQRSRKEVPGRYRRDQRRMMFRTRASMCLEAGGRDREWTEDQTLSH